MILPLLFGLFLSLSAYAQQVSVEEHVKDSAGEPVIGADMIVKNNSSVGTITDLNGNFILSAPQHSTLMISFIGYKPVEVKTAPSVTVTPRDDAMMLQEAVVISYGIVKKSDVTSSVMAIDTDKMVKGMTISASDLLVGKTVGVSVVTDGGAPGVGATIRVCGGPSVSANNNPLIAIGGVPIDNTGIRGMDNPLSTIHPNDIKTFTILKDASTTAIYGPRTSSGVITITAKKGRSGRVKVDYSNTFSINTKSNTVNMMRIGDFRNFVTEEFGENSLQANALGKTSTDWRDEVFRTALNTDHNVGASGAIPHMPYRASVAYTNENDILKTSNMQRLTGAINLSPNFFDKRLSIQLNVEGVYNKNRFADHAAIGLATQYNPIQPVCMKGNPYGNGYFMYMRREGDKISPIDIGLTNPIAMLKKKDNKPTVYRSIGNAQIDYKFYFLPELRANLSLGYDVSKNKGDAIIADSSPLTYCMGDFKSGLGENSRYTQSKHSTLLDLYLNYTDTFGVSYIDATVGYSQQHFYNSTTSSYPYSAAYAEKTREEFYKKGDDYTSKGYLVSFFERLNYTLLNRYLVTFTLHNDGSSRFSPDNRWGLFPSVALAWKLNRKSFLKSVNTILDLKLRLSYGVTEQQNLGNGDYPYMTRYMYSKAGANCYFDDTEYSLIAPQPYNQNLKWEETTTWSVGIDYGFLNGRITGTIGYHSRKTKGLLNTITAPAGTSSNNQLLANVDILEDKGFELSINTHAVSTKGWNWNIGYSISYDKNKITEMTFNDDPDYAGVIHGDVDGGTGYNALVHRVSEAFSSFHVFEQVYDPDGRPIEGAYVDQNGDSRISDADLTCFRKTAPDVLMGLTSQLSYENWDFSFALRGSSDNYVYNNIRSNHEAYEGVSMYDQTGFLRNRLTSARSTDLRDAQYRSSYYIQNASFVRMNNIFLGYTFNKFFNDGQGARIYATVQNPFVITEYRGLNPRISNEGIDNNTYPRPHVFMIGLDLNF